MSKLCIDQALIKLFLKLALWRNQYSQNIRTSNFLGVIINQLSTHIMMPLVRNYVVVARIINAIKVHRNLK